MIIKDFYVQWCLRRKRGAGTMPLPYGSRYIPPESPRDAVMNLKYIFVSLLLLVAFSVQSQTTQTTTIRGKVTDAGTGKGIPFANIRIVGLYRGTGCDTEGNFQLSLPAGKSVVLQISSLGYASRKLEADGKSGFLYIGLQPQSIELPEFTVTANYQDKTGGEVKIGQEALEYIQPTSVTDALLLLPGSIIGSNNMQARNNVSFRQSGNDLSTAFGMGVTVDGIPMSNDGSRVQMSGFTGSTAIDPNGNLAVNAGVDLRTLSTDHIESITVTKGIASAKEGNLSSGLIRLHSKKGETPFRFRTKLDPLNKLVYAGKGFKLPGKAGTLHVGADIVQSAADVRERKSAYNRITAQINYSRVFYRGENRISLDQKLSFVSSFNNMKSDEEIIDNREKYKTTYQRYTWSTRLEALLSKPFVDKIELFVSADFSKDYLFHDKKVFNQGITAIQSSLVEGESEGEYLPKTYRTSYSIDNRPRTLYARLDASKSGNFIPTLTYTVEAGTAMRRIKNKGEGPDVDPARPPFPSDSFIRPRPNSAIPALVDMAYYLDSRLRYEKQRHEFVAALGLRATQMLNLPQDYTLHNRLLLEPRIQFAYTLHHNAWEKKMAHTLRAGFGIENKLPSADYLYPDKIYRDFIVLNAYFDDPDKRLLITDTRIYDPVNPRIRENKNRKVEIGWDLEWDGYVCSLSAFQEKMAGGIEYFTEYVPVEYSYYDKLKHPVDGKPSKEDFYSCRKKDFTTYTTPVNSSKVVKKGIEYRVRIPRIEAVKSEIEINGAYYKTLYTSGVPVMFRPSVTEDNKPYQFVGIYDGFDKTYSERFNTNVWINTHIPKLKLIFTNFFQFIWMRSSRLGKDVDVYPSHYMDMDGIITRVTPEEIEADPRLHSMKRDFLSAKYNTDRLPVSMVLNLKLTKELNKHIRLSFFADNLLDINPIYHNNYLKTQRSWKAPFFGTELIMNF